MTREISEVWKISLLGLLPNFFMGAMRAIAYLVACAAPCASLVHRTGLHPSSGSTRRASSPSMLSLEALVDDSTLTSVLSATAVGGGGLFALRALSNPLGEQQIYVRPGVGAHGVGLICVRDVPEGGLICRCEAEFAKPVPSWQLATLDPGVRRTVLELFDGCDGRGTCQVPTQYDQAIPLISFINHSEQPNCIYVEPNAIVAVRRLRRGEECTVDYLRYQDPGSYTYKDCQRGFR